MKLKFLKEKTKVKVADYGQLIFRFKYIEIIIIHDFDTDRMIIRKNDDIFNYLIEETYIIENKNRKSIKYRKEIQDRIDNRSSAILAELIKDNRKMVKNKKNQLKLAQNEFNEVNRNYNEVAEYYAKEIMFI